jgi:peptidoglycan/xylan/chitin deacetylase (PgdA/CDA1 family)
MNRGATTTTDRLPREIAAASPLRRMVRGLRSVVSSRAVVLLYHRVGEGSRCPHALAVTPERFEQQMRAVRAFGEVLSLAELAERIAARRLPRRAVAITFDDGYADNLLVAKPILERYGVPATVFATTGSIGREREFWWDELQQLLLEPGELPEALHLELDGRRHDWPLGTSARYDEPDADANGTWRMDDSPADDPSRRHRAYRAIYALLWDLSHVRRLAMLDALWTQARRSPVVRAERRAMSDNEIVRLATGGLIEVGAHTHTHPNLAAQTIEVQRDEVVTSKLRLETILGRPVDSFAYPFGLHTAQTVEVVRQAGFTRACACLWHAVRHESEPLRLTRADLGDLDGPTFSDVLRAAVRW